MSVVSPIRDPGSGGSGLLPLDLVFFSTGSNRGWSDRQILRGKSDGTDASVDQVANGIRCGVTTVGVAGAEMRADSWRIFIYLDTGVSRLLFRSGPTTYGAQFTAHHDLTRSGRLRTAVGRFGGQLLIELFLRREAIGTWCISRIASIRRADGNVHQGNMPAEVVLSRLRYQVAQ